MIRQAVFVLVAVLLPGLVLAGETTETSGFIQPSTIDMQKASSEYIRSLLEHACWPTASTIRAKRYRGSVAPEVAEMRKMIERVMREEYRPTELILKRRVVPVTELYGGADCLLLDYRTENGYRIQIQDSQRFHVLITAPPDKERKLSEVGDFVRETANAVLAAPDKYLPGLQVRVGSTDVGESYLGALQYGAWSGFMMEDWYTDIEWWSDGRQVLFGIPRRAKAEYDKLRGLATIPIESPPGPRVFASRKNAGS